MTRGRSNKMDCHIRNVSRTERVDKGRSLKETDAGPEEHKDLARRTILAANCQE